MVTKIDLPKPKNLNVIEDEPKPKNLNLEDDVEEVTIENRTAGQ